MIATPNRTVALENNHVLVVDDDIELSLLYQGLLQAHGYRVSTAANGAQALKLVAKGQVDAILCDLSMPELAGDLFYLEVGRAQPQLLKRFIFVTANADNQMYEAFLRKIKAPVLSKPVSTDRLVEKLEGMLRASAGG
jgi:CheY-like chemotaxis protein